MEKFTGINENWKETKRKLKLKFVVLTDSDLLFVKGRQNEMLVRLQGKLTLHATSLLVIRRSEIHWMQRLSLLRIFYYFCAFTKKTVINSL
jgi:hypothetical protein